MRSLQLDAPHPRPLMDTCRLLKCNKWTKHRDWANWLTSTDTYASANMHSLPSFHPTPLLLGNTNSKWRKLNLMILYINVSCVYMATSAFSCHTFLFQNQKISQNPWWQIQRVQLRDQRPRQWLHPRCKVNQAHLLNAKTMNALIRLRRRWVFN